MRFSGKVWRQIAVAVLISLSIAVIAYKQRIALGKAYEDVVLRFHPSAAAAYSYGVKHFDARYPLEYDVNRAYAMFSLARELDPAYPAVYHQIGRIEFLRGNLTEALALLDKEFATNPEPSPSSYYVRALIRGYQKDYLGAASDYEAYFKETPATWGAINDYAWVLMKAELQDGALAALDWGLSQWPENAWLLSNRAIALYELKRYKEAYETAQKAQGEIEKVTEADWFTAYPGNDPQAAAEGLASFKASARENFDKISLTYRAQN